jgi:MinD-like ATPase involved in chromosome partitioning or flagellar assembly
LKESQLVERKKSTKKVSAPVTKVPSESTVADSAATEVTPDSIDLSVPEFSIPISATTDGDEMYLRRHTGVADTPEPTALLTDERLLDIKVKRVAPEGFWQALVYAITFHTVHLGDSRRARARKAMEARIATPLVGDARFVPVLTRKGGVGKTTTTVLLGMALARIREDRVIAIDANPDRGTLADRVQRETRDTIRSVVAKAPAINSFSEFAKYVSHDVTRLHVLASDSDPLVSQAFDEFDYNIVADITSRYYSIVLTDCGTGIVNTVMRPILQRADGLVIVSGGSVDEARLASETLTWLESNGHAELVANSIVVINTATQNTVLVKLDEIENHFRSRVRDVVRIPYDAHIAAGSVITWDKLSKLTRDSASLLAGLVAEGLPSTK